MSLPIVLVLSGTLLFLPGASIAAEDDKKSRNQLSSNNLYTTQFNHHKPMQLAYREVRRNRSYYARGNRRNSQGFNPFRAIGRALSNLAPRPGNFFRVRPPVPSKGPANAKGTVVFNPRTLSWAAYDSKGDLVNSGRAAGGRDYCPDVRRACRTPTGRFRVYAKGDEYCVSRKYPLGNPGAPMPHCMYFHGGYALHGAYDVPNWNASHGCIRVTPADAAWLHRNFVHVGTVVVVRPY